MIDSMLGLIAANPLARVALRYGAMALAIILFLLSIRRTGERAGRIAERLEANGLTACPAVVEYSREFQARAAEELELLPYGSAVVEMMGDYAVLREQVRLCQS